ncbi:peroxygenase isoform X2 [Oryza sativa Japonica Group]|nr:hypothetical protein EE612_013515 [Oryza sativa]
MDARRRRLSPVVVVAAFLFFPLFFGSQPAAAYGEASGAGGMTALQKHAAFFDKDNDGFVSPTETYDGLRALGLGAGFSILSAALINGVLSLKTRPRGYLDTEATRRRDSRDSGTETAERVRSSQRARQGREETAGDARAMDARRRRLSPAVAVAAALLFFPMFFGSHTPAAAAAYGEASGDAGVTALQKHAAFFDKDGDGIVSLSETYDGLRALGLGSGLSSLSAAFINGVLSPKTRPDNGTAPRLSIYIENIYKGIHGSDSSAYDSEGRFVAEKFEEIFAKHAKTVPDALTSDEIDELLQANRKPGDYTGWVAASSEWKILYKIGKDKDGLLRKEAVREVYDGSLFTKLAAARINDENQA